MSEKVNYNPDILSCLANLSSDEVFTPPEIANAMLDMLPKELFCSPDTKFLDPGCKSGVFLREIAKRLNKGLENRIPNLEERMEHIMKRQLFGIAITQITGLLSRRSVYCSKDASSRFSIAKFVGNPDGNIRYKRVEHKWNGIGCIDDQKCTFCGASRKGFDRGSEYETHAYEFIHMDGKTLKELKDMKFDVIIGNPPYQISDGGNGASASPLYHHFVNQAMKLQPRYLIMIIPARWYAGGKGLDEFRGAMLSQKRISCIVDIANSADCFPGVNIAGGVCYFLWERDYTGDCNVKNEAKGEVLSETLRPLNEFSYFVRNNTALSIIRKAIKGSFTMCDAVFPRNYFGISTTVTGVSTKKEGYISVFTSKGDIYLPENQISDKSNILNKNKVVVTYAMSGGNKPSLDGTYQVLSSLKILMPNEACSETYLIIGTFVSCEDAKHLTSYASTKFFRFLLLQALTSIHITKDRFCFVPIQDFSKPWTDAELYEKYGLTDEEIAFIESMIKPMDIGGADA